MTKLLNLAFACVAAFVIPMNLLAQVAGLNATDPAYLQAFGKRTSMMLDTRKFWVFDAQEFGSRMGCWTWGCKDDAKVLVGERVVFMARFQPDDLKEKSPGMQLERFEGIEYLQSYEALALKNSPPALISLRQVNAEAYRSQIKSARCGTPIVEYCKAVIWGTVRYSAQAHKIPYMVRKTPYYFVEVEGLNIYDASTLADIFKESAAVGVNMVVSGILKSGFRSAK